MNGIYYKLIKTAIEAIENGDDKLAFYTLTTANDYADECRKDKLHPCRLIFDYSKYVLNMRKYKS